MRSGTLILATLSLVAAACGDPASDPDASTADTDGRALDARVLVDVGLDASAMADAASVVAPDAGGDSASATSPDAGSDAPSFDGGPPDVGAPDAPSGPRVIGVRVLADGACSDLSFDPPSISVPEGTSFTVNWINATGCTEVDIDKDGTVPIVIGLEPGASYHDTVRQWCGTLFTGTFSFRAYYAPSFPYYLDVDCSG